MVEAMMLGGLHRCGVLGLRRLGTCGRDEAVFIADGKGGRQRLVPLSGRFFTSVASYLDG